MTVVNPKSISGITSITTASGSDNLLTIHTSDAANTERLRIDSTGTTKIVTGIVTTLTATTGIVTTLTTNTLTANSTTKVGTGITLSPDGDVFATGISTFVDGVTITGGSNSSNLTVITSNNDVGILSSTDSGANVDLFDVNAQSRIRTVSGRLHLYADFNTTVSDSAIRFFVDGSNEVARISPSAVGIGTASPATPLHTYSTGSAHVVLHESGPAQDCRLRIKSQSNKLSSLEFADDDADAGEIRYDHTNNFMAFHVNNNTEKIRITNGGFDPSTDAATDIGNSSKRFRDLYLSSGIFLGGTTSSNELDDYEEGDWTPTYEAGSSSITVNAYSVQYGKYVKIGKMVYIEGGLRANVTNNSNGTYDLGGLPFTVANTTNASGIIHGKEQSSWTIAPHHFSCMQNTTKARARGGIDVGDNAYTNANSSGFNSGSTNNNRIYFAGSYRAEE